MNRDEVISKAKAVGWDAQECNDPAFIAIRAYKSDTSEAMRIGSNGEFYTRGADGWMWQVGTIEDVANAVKAKEQS